ncbi:sensor domain-containing diguanylate cyclase [Thalassotalea profundi]|uniref:diguanylate cyclase n=1 Tax=Thalassotalea profundi TaxID=2036687 RepID=A0ABQ3IYF5_9GAMM|nr:diguanylate cyclase [Thalassotalea profundi]GHE95600.1 deoxynucleoside kinase [Thalassotalea profundi]
MNKNYINGLLFLCLQILAFRSFAVTYDIVVTPDVTVSSEYSMLSSQFSQVNIHQVFNLPKEAWTPQESPLILSNGTNWLAIDITNSSEQEANFYIMLNNDLQLKDMMLYEHGYGNTIKTTTITPHYNGLSSARLRIPAKETWRVYLTANSDGASKIHLDIVNSNEFVESLSTSQYVTGIAIGGMFTLALVMLMLFAANGSKWLLILCAYFTVQAMSLSVLLGINLYSFFPEMSEFRGLEIPLLTSFSAILLMWFTRELFDLKNYSKTLNKLLRVCGWLLFSYLPLSMLFTLNTNLVISKLIDVVIAAALIGVGVFLIKHKQRLALLFTIVIFSQLVFLLTNLATTSWYGFNTTLYIISYWLHGFLITFVLSRQYYYQNLDSERAQKESLENEMLSRQAQEELLTLQQETQEQLEVRVQERTLELNIALQELEEANRELAEKNTLDDLTGLYNRRYYDQKLLAEFRRSRRNLTPLSIVVIDIDHFKSVNDTYGHIAGDNCLIILAKIIKEGLRRSTDVGCRYGGEEFCLILPETDTEGAIAIAEELRAAVQDQVFTVSDKTINLSISCGVSTYKQQKDLTPEDLFLAADKALYQAKNQGRDRVIVFDLNTLETE